MINIKTVPYVIKHHFYVFIIITIIKSIKKLNRREINMAEEYIKGILDTHIANIRDNIKRCDMSNFGEAMKRSAVYAEAERRKDEISNDEYWVFMKEIEKLAKNANQKCECKKKVE